jgi:hypothetical protein
MVKGIVHILISDTDVQTVVGRNKAGDKFKVFPVVCPSQEEKKYITVSQTGKPPVECKTGSPTSWEGSFDVICWAKNYDDLDEMEVAVVGALDNKAEGTYNGVKLSEIRYANGKDLFSNEYQLYARVISFNCWIDESTPT